MWIRDDDVGRFLKYFLAVYNSRTLFSAANHTLCTLHSSSGSSFGSAIREKMHAPAWVTQIEGGRQLFRDWMAEGGYNCVPLMPLNFFAFTIPRR